MKQGPERDRMITENLPLVYWIAGRAFPAKDRDPKLRTIGSWDDLLAEGTFALVRAVDQYDPHRPSKKTGKPVAFSTFAVKCILNHLLNYVNKNHGLLRKSHNELANQICLENEDLCLEEMVQAPRPKEDPDFELLEALQKAFKELPKKQRALLEEIYYKYRNGAEIGREIGLSRQAIKLQEQKALAHLRRKLYRWAS